MIPELNEEDSALYTVESCESRRGICSKNLLFQLVWTRIDHEVLIQNLKLEG